MTMFGRDSIFTSLQALPFTPELAATTLRALGDWQGSRVDDFRDEDPGRILHEMRYGEMTAFEERPHSPVLRLRRRDAAVRRAARRVRALDRRHGSSCASSSTRRAPRSTGSTSTPTSWATATSGTSGATRRPASRTSAGRTRGTRSPTATARFPASRGRPASCRATRTTRRCAAPAWRASSGRTRRSPTSWRRRPPTSSAASTATSGSRTASTSRSRSTPRASRSTALASNNGHLLWSGIVDKSKAKAVARAPARPAALLRLGRPDAGRGRGALQPDRLPRRHGLAVRQLVHRLGPAPLRLQGGGGADRRRASSTPPSSSTGACRRRSAATSGR